MGWLPYVLSKLRRYDQTIVILTILVILYLYAINAGYRLRKVDPLNPKGKKPYIRSVNYQCVKRHQLGILSSQSTSTSTSSSSSSSSLRTIDPSSSSSRHNNHHHHQHLTPSSTYSQEDLELIPHIRFKLYIITHDEKSQRIAERWSQCAPWTEIIHIESTVFFESIVFQHILPTLASKENSWNNYDYIGIATYKTLKMTSMEKLKAYLELAFAKSYDVVPLMTTGEHLQLQAVRGHGEAFIERWKQLLLAMNYSQEDIVRYSMVEVFLRNTYLIKPKWLLKLSEFMKTAIETYQQNQQLQSLFKQNAHYRELKLKVAKKIFHQNYYEWHPFIFERLPCFFFHYYNASIFTTLRQVVLFDNPEVDTLFKGL